MGFSVSGSAVVIFIGFMVAVGLAVPTLAGTLSTVTESQGQQIDRGVDTLNTELDIETAEYREADDELVVEARNTGSTSLSVVDTSLLVDDVLITDLDREVDGAGETNLWMTGDLLRFTVTDVESREDVDSEALDRAKVVAENGIDDVTLEIEVIEDG